MKNTQKMLTLRLGTATYAMPIEGIEDVTGAQALTRVPRAPDAVAGIFNLRGRIITAIDLRRRLGLASAGGEGVMNIVLRLNDAFYSFQVDGVGEVIDIELKKTEKMPDTINARHRRMTSGVCHDGKKTLVLLDCARIIDFTEEI